MGKKLRGAALRAKKRAREAVDAIQEQQAETAAQSFVAHQSNEELFVLDTTGKNASAAAARRNQSNKKPKHQHGTAALEKKEQEQVEKWMKKYDNDPKKLAEVAQKGRELIESRRLRTRGMRGTTKATFDLWSISEETEDDLAKAASSKSKESSGVGSTWAGIVPSFAEVQSNRRRGRSVDDDKAAAEKRKKAAIAVDIAKSGQSYCPDAVAHEAILAVAVKVELAREEAEIDRNTPLENRGMSEETRALLVYSSDSSDDENEKEEDENDASDRPLIKRVEKKTRAQRNKEKRLRREKAMLEKRKREKKLLNEVSEVPRYVKEIKRTAKQQQEKKEQLVEAAKTQVNVSGKDLHEKLSQINPITAPTLPVALPSELQQAVSLRTVKPKGNLASERIASLVDRNLAVQFIKRGGVKRAKKSLKGRRNNQGTQEFGIKG